MWMETNPTEGRNYRSLDFHSPSLLPSPSLTSAAYMCSHSMNFGLTNKPEWKDKWKNHLFSNLWKTILKAVRTYYLISLSRVKEVGLIRGGRQGLEIWKMSPRQGCWIYPWHLQCQDRGIELSEGWHMLMYLMSESRDGPRSQPKCL